MMKHGSDGKYDYQAWPSYATGPNGERRVFDSEAEVPAGWTHHGETKKGKTAPAAPPPPPPSESPNAEGKPVGEKDAAGTVFDPERHTGSKTQAGLWRMKVGVSRPESESQPVKLDL
jgi:hypothetical protein